MKILHILPELEIGGVERHVVDLSNELAARGHEVLVVSAGGRMEDQLSQSVRTLHLPVQKKNPFTGYFCARKIARLARKEKFDIIHAHSRVPAWIAMWASHMSGVPYVVTAHSIFGTQTRWIYRPYREAGVTICVSDTVQKQMCEQFGAKTTVIVDGVKAPAAHWDEKLRSLNKFLYVGRITTLKGLQDVLEALPNDRGHWSLDVVGDGPQKGLCEELCRKRGIADRVIFHGFRTDIEDFMLNASCLLFPSHSEGLGLVAAQAALIGLPVLASHIPAVVELKGDAVGLVPPGNVDEWRTALQKVTDRESVTQTFSADRVRTLEKMVDETLLVYEKFCGRRA